MEECDCGCVDNLPHGKKNDCIIEISAPENMMNTAQLKFLDQRRQHLNRYNRDEPILTFLRGLYPDERDCVLFFLGEMDDEAEKHKETVWWCLRKDDRQLIHRVFSILCPDGSFHTRGDRRRRVYEFRYTWRHENDMNPIVFDKMIFPDFCCLDKKNLVF